MEKFKIAVSKWNKKYSLVITAETEQKARERAHTDWYTILNVEKFSEQSMSWNRFIFKAIIWWKVKNGIILWDDIFKLYVKLKKDLKYDVKELYLEKDKDRDIFYKQKILKSLEEWYKSSVKKIVVDKSVKRKEDNNSIDNFYLKKELENTYKLIDLVLKKLDFFITWNSNIDPEYKEKIKNAYNNIVKLKKSTNLFKLKQIWEIALLKIWEIELKLLEKNKTKETVWYLKETNVLLKKLWSKKQLLEKGVGFSVTISNYIDKIKKNFLIWEKTKIKARKWLDKESYSFLKTLILLSKYKSRLRQNRFDILKNIKVFLLPFWNNIETKEHLIIKRKVIRQNISILKAKKSWKVYSYTAIIKWYKKGLNIILRVFWNLLNYLFYVIILYTLVFIISYTSVKIWYKITDFNYLWIYYFIYILIFFIFLTFSRGLLSLIFNFVFFFFIVIFWIINF